MIKNTRWRRLAGAGAVGALAVAMAATGGCSKLKAVLEPEAGPAGVPEGALQGVVEFEETTAGFELGGRVQALHVKEGDRVEKGQLLATLDDELTQKTLLARNADAHSARAEVDRVRSGARREDVRALAQRVEAAKASEALIEKKLARERSLYEKNVVAMAGVDELEGQLARAQAERRSLEESLLSLKRGAKSEEVGVAEARALAVEAALDVEQVRLERHELYSPDEADILDVHVELGEVIGAGSAVITLANTAHPYVDVFVPQGKLEGIVVGKAAKVKVDSLAQPLPGKVEHVAQRTEFTPRFLFSERERPNLVVRVRVRVDDPKRRLHAGVPAFVTVAGK